MFARAIPRHMVASRRVSAVPASMLHRATPHGTFAQLLRRAQHGSHMFRSSLATPAFAAPKRRALVRPRPVATNFVTSFGQRYPFLFQLLVCTAKTSLCDILIQTYVEKKKRIDWKRNMVFVAFGSVYLGGVQYALYSMLFPRIFPYAKKWVELPLRQKLRDRRGLRTLAGQVVLDCAVHNPFLYIPVFYCFKEAIAEDDSGAVVQRSPSQVLSSAMQKYKTNFWEDTISMAAVAAPGDLFAFGAPMWLRLPVNHVVSFFWVCYLSFLRGAPEAAVAEQ